MPCTTSWGTSAPWNTASTVSASMTSPPRRRDRSASISGSAATCEMRRKRKSTAMPARFESTRMVAAMRPQPASQPIHGPNARVAHVNEVPESGIAAVLRRVGDPADAADELVRLAVEGGGRDNVTVVVVDVVDDDDRGARASAALRDAGEPTTAASGPRPSPAYSGEHAAPRQAADPGTRVLRVQLSQGRLGGSQLHQPDPVGAGVHFRAQLGVELLAVEADRAVRAAMVLEVALRVAVDAETRDPRGIHGPLRDAALRDVELRERCGHRRQHQFALSLNPRSFSHPSDAARSRDQRESSRS